MDGDVSLICFCVFKQCLCVCVEIAQITNFFASLLLVETLAFDDTSISGTLPSEIGLLSSLGKCNEWMEMCLCLIFVSLQSTCVCSNRLNDSLFASLLLIATLAFSSFNIRNVAFGNRIIEFIG